MGVARTGPWTDFVDAAANTVHQLAARIPLDLWLVTRSLTCSHSEVTVAAAGRWSQYVSSGTPVRDHGLVVGRGVTRSHAGGPGLGGRLRSHLAIPLVLGDGSLRGWLRGSDSTPEVCAEVGVVGWAELAGRALSTVLDAEWATQEREREVSRAQALAERDALTGVRNRRGWEASLAEHQLGAGSRAPYAVLVLDLDDFKRVNDDLGHTVGDEVLVRCASVLRTTCRISDVLARPGGDEFTVLASLDTRGSGELLRRLRSGLEAVGIAASMGAAVREAGEDLYDTWRRADAAMYHDKRARKAATAERPAPASSPACRVSGDDLAHE